MSSIVVISNRLPVHRVNGAGEGDAQWEISPGGLVSALKPILERHPGTWIGWAGDDGEAPAPFDHEGIRNHPVALSEREIEMYYEGFCNRTIWPLYHDAVRPPEFRRRWWREYVTVNERFAAAAAEVTTAEGLVWVNDYHLQLVPAMLRAARPDARIGFFLHIPFPPQELFAQLPWRRQLLMGLLGADVVGFQTRQGAQNFADLVRRFTDAGGTREGLRLEGREIRAAEYPVSIDVDRFEQLARSPTVKRETEECRRRLGGSRRILLGVDRMDYTKGIDIRLRAFQQLLRQGTLDPATCVLVQVAVPSRERVDEYQQLRSEVEQLVGEINGEFGELGLAPIHYLHRSLPIEELVALYCAADVMIVTPFRDGMNLVAKEYVASRIDDTGVLVLSEFTGSAKELRSALLVNPHDVDGLAASLDEALSMSAADQRRRMRRMRSTVRNHDVFHWAAQFLGALEA